MENQHFYLIGISFSERGIQPMCTVFFLLPVNMNGAFSF
jgi:hypothetical protein